LLNQSGPLLMACLEIGDRRYDNQKKQRWRRSLKPFACDI
jgi:hypothetical protein